MSFLVRCFAVAFVSCLFLPGLAQAQEVCTSGADEDGDTFIDCLDQDCIPDAACVDEDWDGDTISNGDELADQGAGGTSDPTDSFFCGDSDGDTCDDCNNFS
ncbi:MAG TPA: hypothetical protein DIU15_18125, partial [Deltaproteobacteria bacterium]|nr:hypothetical protein [Deltaproteobacteria bacterium]